MKRIILSLALFITINNLHAQNVPTGTEKAVVDSVCNCLSALDQTKITGKAQATAAINQCFGKLGPALTKLAEERHVDMTDHSAMRDLGIQIGKDLLTQNCSAFMQLSIKLASDKIDQEASLTEGSSRGTFKRIDNKGFNYLVVSDDNSNENSFIWLRQFPDSDKFMNSTTALTGKKLKIAWREMEVYLPAAKGYYKVKEITSIEML